MDLTFKKLTDKIKYNWNKVHLLLIVSTGRTGTEFLAHTFNEYFPKVIGKHEPLPSDLFEVGVRRMRGEFTFQETLEYIRSNRIQILQECVDSKVPYYVESNLHLSILLDVCKELFPHYRILHVVRDPRTCVPSYLNKSPDGSGKMFFMGANDHRDRLTAKDIPEDSFKDEWDAFDRMEKVAWHWRYYNEAAYHAGREDPNYRILHFEELFHPERGVEVFEDALFYCGWSKLLDDGIRERLKEAWKQPKNKNPEKRFPSFEEWSEEDKASFYRVIGDSLERFGYER